MVFFRNLHESSITLNPLTLILIWGSPCATGGSGPLGSGSTGHLKVFCGVWHKNVGSRLGPMVCGVGPLWIRIVCHAHPINDLLDWDLGSLGPMSVTLNSAFLVSFWQLCCTVFSVGSDWMGWPLLLHGHVVMMVMILSAVFWCIVKNEYCSVHLTLVLMLWLICELDN